MCTCAAHNGERNSSFALATLRKDGFAGLRGSGNASLELTCAGPNPCTTLWSTADILSPDGEWSLTPGTCHFTANATNTKCTLDDMGQVDAGKKLIVHVSLDNAIIYTLGLGS